MGKKSKPKSITAPLPEKPQVKRVQLLGSGTLKIILLATLAAGASIYGVVRHFTHPYKTMLVPAEPEYEILYEDDGGTE